MHVHLAALYFGRVPGSSLIQVLVGYILTLGSTQSVDRCLSNTSNFFMPTLYAAMHLFQNLVYRFGTYPLSRPPRNRHILHSYIHGVHNHWALNRFGQSRVTHHLRVANRPSQVSDLC